MRFTLGIFTFMAMPFLAFAADAEVQNTSDILISPTGGTPKSMIYTVPPGSNAQGALKVGNTTGDELSLKMSIESSDGGELQEPFASLRFFSDIPEDYKEQFQSNGQHIDRICKKRDESADLDAWCEGKKELSVDVPREDGVTVYYTVAFSQEHNAKAVIVAAPKENVVEEERTVQTISYVPQIKKVYRGEIRQLKLTRAFDLWDIGAWVRAGFHEAYDAEVEMVNLSTQDLPYTVEMFVRQKDAETPHSKEGVLGKGETKNDLFDTVTMPRFGAVSVYAKMRYDTPEGEQIAETEEASIVITPMREIIGTVLGLIILGIIVAIIRRRKAPVGAVPYPNSKKDTQPSDAFTGTNPGSEIASHATKKKGNIPTQSTEYTIAVSTNDEVSGEAKRNNSDTQQQPVEVVGTASQDQGLDIDWIKEDDEVFAGAMRVQERRANMRVGAFALLFLGICVIVGFFLLSRDILFVPEVKELSIEEVDTVADLPEMEDTVTDARDNQIEKSDEIDDTTAEDEDIEKDEVAQGEPEEKSEEKENAEKEGVAAESDSAETTKKDEPEKSDENDISAEGIKIRVLNGSGRAGAAGTLSTLLKKTGYTASAPTNAINTYAKTTIYHTSKNSSKTQAKNIKTVIADTYSDAILEESDVIVGRHGVDVLIVIGG